jgi:hypothetical protein
MMVEEDEDESSHVNADETDEEVQDAGLALTMTLIVMSMTSLLRRVTASS